MVSPLKLKSLIGLAILAAPFYSTHADDTAWPVATIDTATTITQETIIIPVIANDIGTNLEIIEVNNTTIGLGSASISSDKQSVIYQSADDFIGSDSFWYAFKDNQGRTNAAQVTVTVNEATAKPLEWPTAVNESPEVNYNQTTEIDVLSNDHGVGLTITEVNATTVALGSVSISGNGQKLLYTPPQNFSGNDELWYVFSDSWGRTNAGKVTPIVHAEAPSTPWPTATPDYADTVSSRSVLIPVLKNDMGDRLSLSKVNTTTVGLGKASIEGKYIRYVPPANYSGQDSFWYDFVDSQDRANSTQVFVNVTKNTELSSIAFCGQHYFTDGTVENTNTANEPIDSLAVELDTSAEVKAFNPPTGTFAATGNRQYFLETQDNEQLLIVEKNGLQSTILTLPITEEIYGIGVKGSALYFSHTRTLTINENLESRTVLLMHDGETTTELGTYNANQPLELMASEDKTLLRYIGYKHIDDDPATNVTLRSESTYHYLEVIPNDKQAIYLGYQRKGAYQSGRVSTIEQLKVLSFDQHLITSIQNVITGRGSGTWFRFSSTSNAGKHTDQYAVLDKAVVSNNRLLLTTTAHENDESWLEVSPTFPSKLFVLDSISGELTELASCE